MRTPTLIVVLCVSILLLLNTSRGQGSAGEFVSGQARFAIRPGSAAPVAYRSINDEVGDYSAFGDGFSWNDEVRRVEVIHLVPWRSKGRSTSPSLPPAAKLLILKHFTSVFKDELSKNSASPIERPYMINGSKGIEVEYAGGIRSLVRKFFLEDRFYIVIAQERSSNGFEPLRRLLDTFRRLDLDEYNTAMIRETDPAALPQNVPTGIHPTDAIERSLNGRVKRIVEKIATGRLGEQVLAAEEFFGRLGYLTRRVTYNEGYAESITNFGWVDGVRAMNQSPVTHRGERIFALRGTFVGWGAPEGYNVITRTPTGQIVDFRFTAKVESKYDDDWKLTERREVSSSGNVSFVETITYSGLGRDIKTGDGSGGFITRRFEVLDKNGNIIEIRTLDDRGNQLSSQKFQYQFDTTGNWIVRRSTSTQRPGVPRPNTATVHRTLEYYD